MPEDSFNRLTRYEHEAGRLKAAGKLAIAEKFERQAERLLRQPPESHPSVLLTHTGGALVEAPDIGLGAVVGWLEGLPTAPRDGTSRAWSRRRW